MIRNSPTTFAREQRGVAIGMAAALVVALVVMIAAAAADRAAAPLRLDMRLTDALRADAFVLVWLAAGIAHVARLRFFSPADIGGSVAAAGDAVGRGRAILQNTLEQVCLAIPVHLMLAAVLPQSGTLIVAMAVLFGIGRLCFWAGYRHGARWRAFGFALTFYPSVGGLAAAMLLAATG